MARDPAQISLPISGKLVVIGAGVLMVTMVVLLVAQLAILRDSREHIVAQDRKINRIVKGADPVFDQVEPVADDARELLREATPLAREAGPALREARPLFREAGPLVRELRATMVPLLADAAPLVRDLRAELVPALRGFRESAFIPRTLLAADLVPQITRILAETLDVQRTTLRIQRSTRRIQKRSYAVQRRTLAIHEEALVHIRSIDRKTGGTAPETPLPAPAR